MAKTKLYGTTRARIPDEPDAVIFRGRRAGNHVALDSA